MIRRAAGNRRFLGRLARAGLRRRPPLGFLRHLRGGQRGRIDLKAQGTGPIVDLARLLALQAGSAETATVARLRSATGGGTAGAAPDDVVAIAELTALQRRWLKDAFQLLHTYQESVRIAFRTDLIA